MLAPYLVGPFFCLVPVFVCFLVLLFFGFVSSVPLVFGIGGFVWFFSVGGFVLSSRVWRFGGGEERKGEKSRARNA